MEREDAREMGRGQLPRAFQPGVGDIIRVQQEATSRDKIHQQLSFIYPLSGLCAKQIILTISFHLLATPWYRYVHIIKTDFVAQGVGEKKF